MRAIASRCQSYCEAEEGKKVQSYLDERVEWERHKRDHPEEYPSQAELDAYRNSSGRCCKGGNG